MRINTNVTALNALSNLEKTSSAVATGVERLSSGLRINRGADDPAGLIISEGLKAQIDGLNQAMSNSQDANNLIKTAEGGLSEVNGLLRSVRTLAVHAANTGANDSAAVQADQTQIASALDSINRIAGQTQFGNIKLLDGTSGTTSTVTDSSKVSGLYVGSTVNGASVTAGAVDINVTQAATQATVTSTVTYASAAATMQTAGTMTVNGSNIKIDAMDTVQTVVDKVNATSGSTGVTASFNTTTGAIQMKQKEYGANSKIEWSQSGSYLASGGAQFQSVSGVNAQATVTIGGEAAGTWTGGQGGSSGLKLSDTSGNSVLLSEQGNQVANMTGVAHVAASDMQFQIGANSGQTVNTSTGNVKTSALGTGAVAGITSLADIDVTSAQGASDAIKVIDAAISQVSVQRAKLGAFQTNTLGSTQRFLAVGVENLSASASQITDANVAQEVMALTKNQILQQAGTSMLAQANSAPQSVLSLLR